ncbi:MAG TPA: 23S rRNA (pseudouridine(1915)-N(3))-methyltransferase RlmH [Ferrovibrio sp.]|jgi:23S rRNA (pseudouridine1915-N3)-methyltransferase|uniref:23S rRNA (pseudouridine(1915)-N(3))-methyltransferase RlmH n=1 Tax=Ferrovibrio sp. TaxID=1917215 RepID=UPI002B4B4E29|nr:23S rRNA (pseudouridine(1915)-N(3))-methyltransferase RlmH [Ferrovibrio sp.]HLT76568.1 23S rRNA (pseudouridine(1915)-N(3))-methyltransferase RlmH [Ferrovibrio sp.]
MKITITCVGRAGRAKHDASQSLIEAYRERLPWPVAIREVEDRKAGGTAAERKAREAALLLAAIPKGAVIIALDERGKSLTSRAFADQLAAWRDHGEQEVAFVIGGADGLDRSVLDRARLTLSLSAMTWPHLLARVMLLEQLYRAWSLQTGHPYHRD